MRVALAFAGLSFASGCVDTSCGEYTLEGEQAGEQCGLMGSFGFVYIDEGMVSLILQPYTALDGDLDPFEQAIATWQLQFRDAHLTPGASPPREALIGTCSRFYLGDPTFYTYPAHTVELEVIDDSRRRQTGGHAWRMRWRIECDDQRAGAALNASGLDLIELGWEASGYDFELYGVPGDWPVTP